MGTQLYPHNEKAYEKVMEAFKTSNRTCICHPTGTGKSYIVAAVCQHFEKVLVLAPNMFVLNQQEEALKGHKSVSYMTYAWLLLHYSEIKTKYDIIVLDEFHRAGAEEWGTAVNLFLESQPQAKVLGTSATPIRYLDNEKDMAKELFNNNIASSLSIAEAWHSHILPIPTYITGYFSFDSLVNTAINSIKNNPTLRDEEKKDRIRRLKKIRLEWQKSVGMAKILKKHLNKDSHRMIVFCDHVDYLEKAEKATKRWLRDAGFKVASTNIIYGKQPDALKKRQMKEFSERKSTGLNLIFAVNILNEGIHIPNVDAVMMLRTTSSKTIYFQQLGRCLTSANSSKPIVLDMVDNITTTSAITPIAEEFNALNENCDEDKKKRREGRIEYNQEKFKIFDYTLNINQMINRLTSHNLTLDERIDIAERFININGRVPLHKYSNEHFYFQNWRNLSHRLNEDPRVFNLFVKYSTNSTPGVFKQRLINFVKQHQHFPKSNGSTDKANHAFEVALYNHFIKNKKKHLEDPEINALYKEYKRDDKETMYQKLTEFCKSHNRMPSRYIPEEKDMYELYNRVRNSYRNEYRFKSLVKTYSVYSTDKKIKEVEVFAREHGYLPFRLIHPLRVTWRNLLSRHSDNPLVQELLTKYKEATDKELTRIKKENITRRNYERKYKNKKVS